MLLSKLIRQTIAIIGIICTFSFCTECMAQRRARTGTTEAPTTVESSDRVMQNPRLRSRFDAMRPWLGVMVKDLPDNTGVRVESALAGSPAEKAGVITGDIITNIAGKAITNGQSLAEVTAGLTIGTDYPLTIIRDGKRLNIVIRPESIRYSQSTSSSGVTIEEISDTPMPRKGATDINVLRYAFIDTKTGTVTFVGKYDPTHNTGPIPYGDILRVASEHPYPAFSLEPPQDDLQFLQAAEKMIDADIARMENNEYAEQWAQKVANLLLDPSLGADNMRFFKHCAQALGITGDELKRMHDAATGKIEMPGTEFMGLAAKMIRGIGLTRAGNALGVLAEGGTPEDLLYKMAVELGLSSEYNNLAARGLSPEDFRKECIILSISEICREFEAPENEIQQRVALIRSGQSADLIIDYMSQRLNQYITNKSGRKMLNGLVLGPQIMARLYNLPVPKSELVFRDLPLDSILGDIFFKSDYRLKSICTFPDAREKIPSHLTHIEFLQKNASPGMAQKLCRVGVQLGSTLVPGEVNLRVSPEGNIVQFGEPKMKITGWIRKMLTKADKETENFVATTASQYGEYLAQHYAEYAKVYPEWHKLSEAAKIIALVRWAKNNGYTLKPAEASEIKASLPKYVNGFWSATLEVDEQSQYLTFTAEGGTSFDKDEGEGWLKVQQDVSVTSDVLKQLAASAVFAEQAVGTAISGDLESARELAEKSAMAMTGEIDLSRLPALDGIPTPDDPATYAAATRAAIDEATACLNTIASAGKEIQRAEELSATSPQEAEKIKQDAMAAQDAASARLQEILSGVSKYKSNPSQASQVLVALGSNSAVISPIGSNSSSGTASTSGTATAGSTSQATGGQTSSQSEEWSQKLAKLSTELDEVNKQIAATRTALLRLNASIQADRKLFEEWQQSSSEALDRSIMTLGDVLLDVGISGLRDRYETIYELAKKLPNDPKDVIEKYRYIMSLTQRMSEAKSVKDFADLAERENKTPAEFFETLRDGVGQISGLLGLDKTVPGMVWKYMSLGCDTAYNLFELRETWVNLEALEANNERYAQAVQKLAAKMKDLVERQKKIKQQIDAGGPVETIRSVGP